MKPSEFIQALRERAKAETIPQKQVALEIGFDYQNYRNFVRTSDLRPSPVLLDKLADRYGFYICEDGAQGVVAKSDAA